MAGRHGKISRVLRIKHKIDPALAGTRVGARWIIRISGSSVGINRFHPAIDVAVEDNLYLGGVILSVEIASDYPRFSKFARERDQLLSFDLPLVTVAARPLKMSREKVDQLAAHADCGLGDRHLIAHEIV